MIFDIESTKIEWIC